MYSGVCPSAKALLGELWREGAFMTPLPLTPPPSLRDCVSCPELCGWKVCVHVRE